MIVDGKGAGAFRLRSRRGRLAKVGVVADSEILSGYDTSTAGSEE